ncbi:Leucine-rich repeat-containing protein, partial [Stegodyphus mimosarum]
MITNIQIMVDEGNIVRLVVDREKKITAAYQSLRTIPHTLADCYGHWVEVLDLSHNMIRDVSGLRSLDRIHTLILDHNLLDSTSEFPRLSSLRVLWLNHNLISDLRIFIPALAFSCPNLQYLSLMGNTAAPATFRDESESEQKY